MKGMQGRNRLYKNIVSLVSLQGMQYILGLILVPYLVRVLGPEQFGAVALMQGVIQYFNIFIDYGFNLTAPRSIAQAAEADISRLFNVFFWGKLFMGVIVTVLFLIFYEILKLFYPVSVNWMLFTAVYCSVIGNIIFPVWFFQGIQQMGYITIFNICGRIITMVLIFVIVRSPEDYVWAAFFQSCTPIFAGFGALWIILRHFPGAFSLPAMNQLKQVYHDGWHIFISTLAINLYTASNIVILGFLTNHTVVGYYSGASKIIGCIKSLLGPVSQAIYPYISQMMKESTQQGMHFLKKLLLLFGCAGTIMSLMIFAGSKFIVLLFLGDQYEPSVLMLQLMSLVPMMVALSNILGIQTMLPLGMEKIFSRILISSAVLNTIIIFPLTISYGGVGTSLTMSITESFVTVTMAVVLWRKYSQGKLFDEK